jgi:hypothetical protein
MNPNGKGRSQPRRAKGQSERRVEVLRCGPDGRDRKPTGGAPVHQGEKADGRQRQDEQAGIAGGREAAMRRADDPLLN